MIWWLLLGAAFAAAVAVIWLVPWTAWVFGGAAVVTLIVVLSALYRLRQLMRRGPRRLAGRMVVRSYDPANWPYGRDEEAERDWGATSDSVVHPGGDNGGGDEWST